MYVWLKRKSPGGLQFALFAAAAAEWALMSALENSVSDMPSKILFAKLAYPGLAMVAPLWFLFTIHYSQRTEWIRSRLVPLLWIIPAVVTALALTNEWHGLTWPVITPASDAPGAILIYRLGPAVYLNAIYAYGLMVVGAIILIRAVLRSSRPSYLPVITLILGLFVSLVANIIYPTSLNPVSGLDVTPLAFMISGLLFTWAIFGQRLFELVPVARETLIQVMADGAIVLDSEGNIVEINPAAERILGGMESKTAGRDSKAMKRWPAMTGSFRRGTDGVEEIMIDRPEGALWLDTQVSILHDTRGREAGRLVVLRDITKRKSAEEELKRSNEALSASLLEKEVLLKEIHHRVKNNLQIVSSILNLQLDKTGDESQATALRDSQDRIRSMALIHEKLYQSRDLSHVDFAEYVNSLAAYLSRSYISKPGISTKVDIRGVFLDIDMAIPCGLIINELVSNSLKYAFKDGRQGEVRVSMTKSGQVYRLAVSDNGVGLPPGMNFRNTTSLGLQLVNTLVDQLEGTIELDAAGGTTFKITFAEIK